MTGPVLPQRCDRRPLALNKVKGSAPDVIIGSVHFAEGVAIVKQVKEPGPEAQGDRRDRRTADARFRHHPRRSSRRCPRSSQWTKAVHGKDDYFGDALAYDADIQKTFGHVAGSYHNAEASAACLALVLATEKAGSTNPAAVRDALAALDVTTFFGQVKFDATGKNVTKPMVVIQIQGGKAVTVWPKDMAEGSRLAGTGS